MFSFCQVDALSRYFAKPDRQSRQGGPLMKPCATGLLRSHTTYYNEGRTHLSVNKDAPSPRTVHSVGRILPTPFLGGLHHLYVRVRFPTGTRVQKRRRGAHGRNSEST